MNPTVSITDEGYSAVSMGRLILCLKRVLCSLGKRLGGHSEETAGLRYFLNKSKRFQGEQRVALP